MAEISVEAVELLKYLLKNKTFFSENYFKASLISARNNIKESDLEPLFKQLVKEHVLFTRKEFLKSPQYMLDVVAGENFLAMLNEEETIYTQEYREALEDEIKKYKKFIITTAVMGKDVNKPFADAIRNYAERNNALVLVLPCEDVVSRGKKAKTLELSSELEDFKVVFKDMYLNKNLYLCAIKVSAKQINPLTGLDRMPVQKEASIIIASPKVHLKYIANIHYSIPYALMTTGAVTVNNYDTERYMSKRTSTLAENDHTYGAVIVEVESEDIFHFRHVQASPYNSITDMGIDYLPDGTVKQMEESVMVMGDSHVGYHDLELHEEVMEVATKAHVKEVILHDIFHGSSISHHDAKKGVTNAIKAKEGRLGLERECVAVMKYLMDITGHGFQASIVSESNHDQHLLKYLEDGRYVSDPINYQFSLKLAYAATEGHNPLRYALEEELGYKDNKIVWLEEDTSHRVYGVEVNIHGNKGANGSRGSLAQAEKAYGSCVTGHTHSAAILRKACTVGTVGLMDMKYNKGLSSWTRTCCLIYKNGTKQLINFIPDEKGEYKYTLV